MAACQHRVPRSPALRSLTAPPPARSGAASGADIDLLRARYGADRSRAGGGLVASLVIVPFLCWVVWAGVQRADQDLRWESVSFDDTSSTSVKITYDVFFPADRASRSPAPCGPWTTRASRWAGHRCQSRQRARAPASSTLCQ